MGKDKMRDDLIPYMLQVPDLELARLKQTEADLESLAAYRRLKLQAYKDWSASMGKEFTYYNAKGELEKIDVGAKRAAAATLQDSMEGEAIGPQYSVRKVYRDYLSGATPGSEALDGLGQIGIRLSPLPTPKAPPLDMTWFDRICMWFQNLIKVKT